MRVQGPLLAFCLALVAPVQAEEGPEPEVVIKPGMGRTIEEYRQNGQLYMIKITPDKGPPYYFIDNDGDGQLETRLSDPQSNPPLPQWILFQW